MDEELQAIYQRIGALLQTAAQPDAEIMVYEGMTYADYEKGGPHWIRADGSVGRYTIDNMPPDAEMDEIRKIMRHELPKLAPFSEDQPYTHYHIELKRDGAFSIDFERIDREQVWAGAMTMKPVGALTREEAKALRIPEENWLLAKRLLEGDITHEEYHSLSDAHYNATMSRYAADPVSTS